MREILWVTPGDLSSLQRGITRQMTRIFSAVGRLAEQNRKTHTLLRVIGEKMGAFEDAMAELATELDGITTGWAEKLEESERVTGELRAALAAAGRPDDEVIIEESAKNAAVVQALIQKLRDAGKDEDAPIDTTPLPDVDDVEPVDVPPVGGDAGDDTGAGNDVPGGDEVPSPGVGEPVSDGGGTDSGTGEPPLSDDVPDEAPDGTQPDFTPDPNEVPAVSDQDLEPGTPLTEINFDDGSSTR